MSEAMRARFDKIERAIMESKMTKEQVFTQMKQAALEHAGRGEPVAWRVVGSYTDCAMTHKSSAKAYCKGLLEGDPEGGYRIEPLYTQPPTPITCQLYGYEVQGCGECTPPAPVAPEWLPMDSAPRDCTQVLLRVPTTDATIVVVGLAHFGQWVGAFWTGHNWKRGTFIPDAWMPIPDATPKSSDTDK